MDGTKPSKIKQAGTTLAREKSIPAGCFSVPRVKSAPQTDVYLCGHRGWQALQLSLREAGGKPPKGLKFAKATI